MPRLQGRSGPRALHHAPAGGLTLNGGAPLSSGHLGLAIPGGAASALVLCALLILAAWLGLRAASREESPRRRAVLVVLRVLTAAAAWCVGAQPTWVRERVQVTEGRLAVLVDVSRSMAVPGGSVSRARIASDLLGRWLAEGDSESVDVSTFGRDLRPSTLERLSAGYQPTEDESRIAGSVEELLRSDARGDLGAVVVVSDGADRSPESGLQSLVRRGVKVHAVAVGGDQALRDDTIAVLQADEIAYLHQPGLVRVVVRRSGAAGEPIPVSLWKGGELVREVVARPGADGLGEVELPFTPDALGRSVYEVTIPVDPADGVPENNQRAFLVHVIRDRLRVLLVAGRPSWDERFLRSFLKADPAIDLVSFYILRTAADLTMASQGELALIPFPTDELFSEHLGSFDLVILQNFEYEPYQMAGYLPRLRDYVLRGGGLAMLGGDLAFASGGYAETPLAEVLPVTMPPSSTSAARAIVTGRFRPRLAADMSRHPILELLPDQAANARAWSVLAPLEGANVLSGLRGDGIALMVHPRRRVAGGGPMPVLAVGTAGRGRSLALATDTSWRWGMASAGTSGDGSAYERFWDRVLRWLTRDPSLEPAVITTDAERYSPGTRVRLTALLRDERYQPLVERSARLSILDSEGHETAGVELRVDADGRAQVDLPGPSEPGGYRVVARLVDEAGPICEDGFVVESGGDELADPRARPDMLRALVRATGGSFHSAQDAPPLRAFDAVRTRSLGVVEVAPFASAWAFLLVVGLFGSEWMVRRLWGRR